MKVVIFYIFVLSIMHVSKARSLPTTEILPATSLLEVIKKKCPALASYKSISNQQELEKCADWTRINATKVLNEATAQDVLCLLYHDSFISFCDGAKTHPNMTSSDIDSKTIATYTTQMVCNKLGIVSSTRTYEHDLRGIIKQEEACNKLCGRYESESPVYECGMAYYFSNFDFHGLEKQGNDASTTTKINSSKIDDTGRLDAESGNKEKKQDIAKESVDNLEPANESDVQFIQPSRIPADQSHTHNSAKNSTDVIQKKTDALPNPANQGLQEQIVKVGSPSGNQHEDQQQANQIPSKVETPNLTKKSDQPIHQNTAPEATQHPATKKVPEKPQTPQKPQNHEIIENNDSKVNRIPEKQPEVVEQEMNSGRFQNEGEKTEAKLSNKNEMDHTKKETTVVKEENDVIDEQTFEEPNAEEMGMEAGLDGEPEPPVEEKPEQQDLDDRPLISNDVEEIDGDSYFFSYFMVICVLFILGYVGYHNRLKVMALVLEGKRNKRQHRGRRPNSANYHKLDSNLEEAITSNITKNTSNVIY